jgi:hypothetical protein
VKITSLADWLEFIDGIDTKARDTLVALGYPASELDSRALFHIAGATHSEYMAGRDDPDRERAAFATLNICRAIHEHAEQFDSDPQARAACLAALAWKLHMTAAALYGEEIQPAFLSVEQSKRGRAGAAKRWSESETVSEIINGLAERTDALGDHLKPKELWPEFFAELDARDLNPTEDRKVIQFDGGGKISYDTFRRSIQRTRTAT